MRKDFPAILPLTQEDKARFWRRVGKTPDCWIFHSSLTRGYGRFSIQRQPYLAHRVSYFMATGIDPMNLVVCHHCDNPQCVRPDHLFLGTRADNNRDMFSKGRANPRGGKYAYGEAHHAAKLTSAKAAEIRNLRSKGETHQRLASQFGVSVFTIKQVLYGRSWVSGPAQNPAQVQRFENAEGAGSLDG